MNKIKTYYVAPGNAYNKYGWFRAMPKHWWSASSFIRTRDYRHAITQYKRLPIRYRQIDVRGDGAPYCIKFGAQV